MVACCTPQARVIARQVSSRQALLGFNPLVLGKLGLSTQFGTALARFHSPSVNPFQDALAFVLGERREESNRTSGYVQQAQVLRTAKICWAIASGA